ncbi:MAG: hypothetical protein HRT35_38840, partial [Algicola sp.]|nr:hypothetical protein [Algicola sp.]
MKGSTFCFCGFLAVVLLFSGVAQAKYDIQARLEEGQEAYANHNYGKAAKLFRRAALKGSAVAQSLLGLMYASG